MKKKHHFTNQRISYQPLYQWLFNFKCLLQLEKALLSTFLHFSILFSFNKRKGYEKPGMGNIMATIFQPEPITMLLIRKTED